MNNSQPCEQCDGCRFWKRIISEADGLCCRFPPPFPLTRPAGWCGEFKLTKQRKNDGTAISQ